MSHRWRWGWSPEERRGTEGTTRNDNWPKQQTGRQRNRRRGIEDGNDADSQEQDVTQTNKVAFASAKTWTNAESPQEGTWQRDTSEEIWRQTVEERTSEEEHLMPDFCKFYKLRNWKNMKKLFSERFLETLQVDNLETPQVAWNLLKFSKSISRDSHTNQARGKLGAREASASHSLYCRAYPSWSTFFFLT